MAEDVAVRGTHSVDDASHVDVVAREGGHLDLRRVFVDARDSRAIVSANNRTSLDAEDLLLRSDPASTGTRGLRVQDETMSNVRRLLLLGPQYGYFVEQTGRGSASAVTVIGTTFEGIGFEQASGTMSARFLVAPSGGAAFRLSQSTAARQAETLAMEDVQIDCGQNSETIGLITEGRAHMSLTRFEVRNCTGDGLNLFGALALELSHGRVENCRVGIQTEAALDLGTALNHVTLQGNEDSILVVAGSED
jgi:hypothetical protein